MPRALYRTLATAMGGTRAARRTIGMYQNKVIDAVTGVLADSVPAQSEKKKPLLP